MSVKDQIRVNQQFEESSTGRLFFDDKTAILTDLSKVRLLRCGVDTVRQLYRGLIRPEIMALFEKPGSIVEFAGQRWHSGRVGRDSGYQYKLQNADLGFVLLVKNFNAKLENIGPHLKIEVSPHAIDVLSPERLQARLDYYAAQVLTNLEANQCAVHLALDLQGWQPPADLVARMHCRARTHRDISGINEIEWATKSSIYGRGETSMFGSASGIQLCIYNKTEQARSTDKLDYWEAKHHGEQGDCFALQLGHVIPGQSSPGEGLHFLLREGNQRTGTDRLTRCPQAPIALTGQEIHWGLRQKGQALIDRQQCTGAQRWQ